MIIFAVAQGQGWNKSKEIDDLAFIFTENISRSLITFLFSMTDSAVVDENLIMLKKCVQIQMLSCTQLWTQCYERRVEHN